jgi:hypothetical protein
MKKFLIRREMEGAGSIPKHELNNADSEELIKEHSERSGAPANEISEIKTVIKHNTSFVS